MKLQDQVCSLELAKKLKELGVKQESLFAWVHPDSMARGKEPTEEEWKDDSWIIGSTQHLDRAISKAKPRGYFIGCISAFTVAELGEMLPDNFIVKKPKKGCGKMYFKKARIQYETIDNEENYKDVDIISAGLERTEANARAKMLIYLLEKKLLNL